ncbi:uncharacterized protein LOC127854991 [Dreissena polymorpha]|uniref:B box-type domain-containing protein n=1 Tax=Dreissena polymorpha TaxID=45954 RepID=A0A9D4C905_DREPO|nr:uncharacterized protein LOC127854991 [Dreissena polymorpha]KAH3719347.1 hypothetical protein DPMN_062179 [Dreissena polymorpha]
MAGIKEETAPIKCGPCLFDGNTVEPRYFCVDCLEYLCTDCIRDHRRNKLLREHKILEQDELPQDIELFEEMKKLSYCNKHTDVEIYRYCPSHGVLVCMYCLQNDHILCKGVSDISCVLEDVSKNVEGNFIDLQSKCKANYTEMMKTIETAHTDINKVKLDINDVIHILQYNVDILEKTLNERLDIEMQSLRLSEKRMSNLEQKTSYYENLQAITSKFGTPTQSIALNFKLLTLLKEFQTDESVKSIRDKQIQFIQPTKVEDLITMLHQLNVVRTRKCNEASELSSDDASLYVDDVKCIETNTKDGAKQLEESLATCEMVQKKDLSRLKVIHDRISLLKFESQHTEELQTSVVAADFLSDGRLILLQQENTLQLYSKTLCSTLQLYSNKLSFTSKFQLQNNVKDMSVVEQNKNGSFTVAVCFDQSSKILFLEYESEFLQKNMYYCSDSVLSISMYVHHMVALVERNSEKSSYGIQLLDIPTGHVCYAFDEFKLSSSQNNGKWSVVKLSQPNRISTCKTTMKVIVADRNTIYRFNIKDGECNRNTFYAVGQCYYESMYTKSPVLMNAHDVKCDTQGNMYVLTNDGFYQLNKVNTVPKRRRLNSCRGNATSIAIDEIRNRLIVGYMNADRAHVFDFILPTDT